MKILILAAGVFILVILIAVIIVLSKKSKKPQPVKNNAVQQPAIGNDKFHEDEMDYKTEALECWEHRSGLVNPEAADKMDYVANSQISTGSNAINTAAKGAEGMKRPKIMQPYAVIEYSEEGCSKIFEMKSDIINIGRDPNYCELIIPADSFMGRNHAAIYFKNRKFFIVDMNSKNGTFVNGERVFGCRELEDGCRLQIAGTEMQFKSCI